MNSPSNVAEYRSVQSATNSPSWVAEAYVPPQSGGFAFLTDDTGLIFLTADDGTTQLTADS